MTKDVMVPTLGESVSEATVQKWFRQIGETIREGENLVELETDKVTLEVPSPVSGVISEILAVSGTDVAVGALLCRIEEGEVAKAANPTPAPAATISSPAASKTTPTTPTSSSPAKGQPSPAASRILAEKQIDPASVPGSGPKGNILKTDALKANIAPPSVSPPSLSPPMAADFTPKGQRSTDERGEERVKLSKLRKVIATRLKEAQNTAAMLTTFNEVNMGPMMEIRNQYKDVFEKKHGARLGFMSFFVRAVVGALKELPAVNAEIFGDEIIYKNYYDIGIAVGTPQGLVVPILRDADKRSFANIELAIADFGKRARDGKLSVGEMQGGTFTITNGGVFGSLLSTPILNPPQSGILGMHKIQKRPIVNHDGQIVVGDMMYLAHSYDHRIIDGREAVTFLVRIKEMLEDPARLLLDI